MDDADHTDRIITKKSLHHEQHLIPMCAALPSLSSQDIWNTNIMDIHRASRVKGDKLYKLHDFTAQILQLVSPRLLNSVKTLPRDWTKVARIMEKAWARYQYLETHDMPKTEKEAVNHEKDPNEPPPIRIVVMGGNVVFGDGCALPEFKYNTGKACAWPYRVEELINRFFGYDQNFMSGIVQVFNLAVGATHSGVGKAVLQYDVLRDEIDSADIIINAYSANDDHDTFSEALRVIQDFYRQALQPHPCKNMPPPLLLHVNDAFGDGTSPLMKSTVVAQVAEILSSYYGSVSISYVDVVRDWVYGDKSEEWFSSEQHRNEPGHGMHLSMAYIVLFNFLHLTTSYCTIQPWHVLDSDTPPLKYYDPTKPRLQDVQATTKEQLRIQQAQQHIQNHMPILQNSTGSFLKGKPQSPPKYILPYFHENLTLSDAHREWVSGKTKPKAPQCHTDSSGKPMPNYRKCPVSWISDHGVRGQSWWMSSLKNYATVKNTWTLTEPHLEKPGYVPQQPFAAGSSLELAFPNELQPISNVAIFYKQSFSKEWADSQATFTIKHSTSASVDRDTNWTAVASDKVSGYHAKDLMEMSISSMQLNRTVNVGESLLMTVTLHSGTNFKVMGIALCSHDD